MTVRSRERRAGTVRTRFRELRVPASIAAVIGARVDRLPDAAKSALEAVSVLGDPITPELVAAMQEVEVARAEELMNLCRASGLLTKPDPARGSLELHVFVFRHDLVRDVVLESPHAHASQGVASARVPGAALAAGCRRCRCRRSTRASRLQRRGMGACRRICGKVDGPGDLTVSQSGSPATLRDGHRRVGSLRQRDDGT